MKAKLLLGMTITTLALAVPVAAQAMTSKIDSTLHLTATGAVQATGPITSWQSDEASAVIHVTVTQGSRSVSGTTHPYQNGATSWSTLATGDRLAPGAAVGHATATVALTGGGSESYSWTVAVTLVRG